MIQETRHYKTRLAVIGSGLAGFAASVFALERGIPTAQIGNTGAIAYTTGYLDLFGNHNQQLLEDPWHGLDLLRRDEPDHPLSRICNEDIRTALRQFTESLTGMGIEYSGPGEHNLLALLPGGTVKPTLSVPGTMLPGVDAIKTDARILITDFVGLQGFSAKELATNLKISCPHARAMRLEFPDMGSGAQVFPEVMARALEVPAQRQRFAELLKSVAGDAEYVGMPAIMGVHAPDNVHTELEKLVGIPLFEIPTMPPAVPGIRLREMFEQQLPAKGLTLVPQQKVKRLELSEDGAVLYLEDSFGEVVIETQTTIMATGRFLSGGLKADRRVIRESLLGIPVRQPESRADWYRQHYFDTRGHPVNRSGIVVDAQFRPVNLDRRPVNKRLFAAGASLAHHDWVRQRCGAGVAIASAYKAVEGVSDLLSPPKSEDWA